jgi:hypothetical protein
LQYQIIIYQFLLDVEGIHQIATGLLKYTSNVAFACNISD